MKLWGGRFEKKTDGLVDDFHSSITFDQRLYHQDIAGSIAHATMLVEAMQKEGVPAHYTPTFDDAEAYLRAHWQPGDLVITMSCGNINLLNAQIQQHGE